MKNKSILLIVFIISIVIGVLHQIDGHTQSQEVNGEFEILIDGVDKTPKMGRIKDSIEFKGQIEMWHHSGGYWKYKDIIIWDKNLGRFLYDEDTLADVIAEDVVFEYKLEPELYNKLIKSKNIKVVCSTTLKDPVVNEYKTIDDIFYNVPSIELKSGKVYLKGKPKLNFYNYKDFDFEYIIGDSLNVQVPLVNPDYGMNLYAIWARNSKTAWGGAWGYFDITDPFATPDVPTIEELKDLVDIPNIDNYEYILDILILDILNIDKILGGSIQELGAISPSQIKDASGHLQEGFKLICGGKTKLSDVLSVGGGTNVLTRKLRSPLANGAKITAKLTLPSDNWSSDGNTTGSLDIKNENNELFKIFKPNQIMIKGSLYDDTN